MNKKLLWIHGWGVSPQIWQHDAAELSDYEHHYISFAECSSNTDFHRALSDRLAKSPGRWTIIGWSMGAMLALELLFNKKQREHYTIEAIVVVAGTLCFVNNDRVKGWPRRVLERMKKQLLIQPEETLQQFTAAMFTSSEKENLRNHFMLESISSIHSVDYTMSGLEAGLTYLLETDLTQKWEQYSSEQEGLRDFAVNSHPVPRLLWIHGSDDAICPIGCIPERLRQQKFVMEHAGHVPFLTQRDCFYEQLRSFLYAHQ